jgi:hypothetical protein
MKTIDYTGTTFELLTIKEFDEIQKKWKCECKCGNIVYYTSRQLQTNKPKSCGCLRSPNIIGRTFGRLKVIEKTDKRDSNYNTFYLCECNCRDENKNTKFVTAHDLETGNVKSCGCLAIEASQKSGKIIGNKTKESCIADTNIRNLTMNKPITNTSGIKGVTWDKSRSKWVAQISFKKKHYYLGRYDVKKDAENVRLIAEQKLFGNFLEWYNNQFKNSN